VAVTPIQAIPFIVDHPFILIGDATTGVQVECAGTNLSVTVDQDENTLETFCGSYTSYKAPKWTITVTIAQSYGAAGSWTLLQPLLGTIQPFEIRPDSATASVDNPSMSGDVLLKYLPFIDAAPGEASEVDLEMAVQGQPVFGITSPVMAASAAAPAPEPQPA
jgi:hypothetical protein